jgi:hypothetical protein
MEDKIMRKEVKFMFLLTGLLLAFTMVNAVGAASYNITDDSYGTYFNASGYINDTNIRAGDVLDLYGTINNKSMYIDRPLNLTSTSKTGKLVNGTITILSGGSGSNVTGLVIINDNQNGIILEGANNSEISNNTISANQKEESYGIYLNEANNNKILGNKINTTGDKVTHGIFLDESSGNEIRLNEIQTTGNVPESDVFNLEFPTLGIYLRNSQNNSILQNTINTAAENNSVAGVNLYYNSNDNKITDNMVTTTGNGNVYGLTIYQCIKPSSMDSISTGNNFSRNSVITTGKGYSNGINLGWYSYNTTVSDNDVVTSADDYAYGLVMIGSFNSNINENNFTTESNINYGATLEDSDNNSFVENDFTGTGNYSIGTALYGSDNNIISKNKVSVKGNADADPETIYEHSDPIPATNVGVYLVHSSENNIVDSNSVITNGEYAVNASKAVNTVIINNYLVSGSNYGDEAVASGSGDTVADNYGETLVDDNVGSIINVQQLRTSFRNFKEGNKSSVPSAGAIEVTNRSTVPMKNTGMPLTGLWAAVLSILGGMAVSKRNFGKGSN